jgi:hypothetical protein
VAARVLLAMNWLSAGGATSAAVIDGGRVVRFETRVIDADFPGAYQVEVVDIDGDGKLDLVVVGGSTCAWYQNPTWEKRILTGPGVTPGVISSATARAGGSFGVVAIAYDFEMNAPKRGKLLLHHFGESIDDRGADDDLGAFPSIHRLRWGNVDGDEHSDLVVAPIFGPGAKPPAYEQEKAQVVVLRRDGVGGPMSWKREVAGSDWVIHAIRVLDFDGDGRDEVLVAGNSGITKLGRGAGGDWASEVLVVGALGEAPDRGCSEIHVGWIRARQERGEGRIRFLATIEPWHGSRVVVHTPREGVEGGLRIERWGGPGRVIDDTLDLGHALWTADIDGDGDDEIFAGHRGKDFRVSMYDFDGTTWVRTVIDRETDAQDLRGGDLDGDGVPDLVAVGGRSKRVVWYRPVRE